jgi:potassium voltage-gated channel Shaw-related subfamily C protein 1
LAILDKLDIETENATEEEVARRFGWVDDYLADDLNVWQRIKPKIYSLFDEPHSSTCARVIIISLLFYPGPWQCVLLLIPITKDS